MRGAGWMAALAVVALAGAARAEVVDASAAGFEVKQVATIAAPANKVWAALLLPGQWWSGKHSWSGGARNLSLEARVGGRQAGLLLRQCMHEKADAAIILFVEIDNRGAGLGRIFVQ